MSTNEDRISLANVDHAVDITHEIRGISARPIGFGGYSDIYTGTWHSPAGEMKVAIKVIRAVPMTAESDDMPRALRREISVWKRLKHRNIHVLCGLYEGFGPVPALISPWYANGHIKSYLRRHLDNPDAELLKLRLFCDIMCGVQFLHRSSIVHGDLKGDNVLISDAGAARLSDFGLSRLLVEHSQSVTYTGVRGTSRWMAPEIFLDAERHSYASDMWACGCLMIEVWNNALPYHSKANDRQLSLALDARELPGSQSNMPEIVWTFFQDCCSFDATQRPFAAHVAPQLMRHLVLQRVSRWVTLDGVLEAEFLNEIDASLLHESSLFDLEAFYFLSDLELATEVVRCFSLSKLIHPQGSQLFHDVILEWCLAGLGIGDLRLPPEAYVLDTDKNNFSNRCDQVFCHSTKLRPFASLIQHAHPGLAKDLMTRFCSQTFRLKSWPCSVAWFPDGNRIALASSDNTVSIRDITGAVALHCLGGHTKDLNQVAVSPNGRLVASCSDDQSIILWDAVAGGAWGAPLVDHTDWVCSVAFAPDSRHIVSGSYDHTIRVWDTELCRTVLGPLRGHAKAVSSVAYSPDGSNIVSGSLDTTVRVWDARTGDLTLTIYGHTGTVLSVAYSPNALRIVSASKDCTVRIWDATRGQPLGAPLQAHSGWVTSVAYSPDGTLVASGSHDCTISIWHAATGLCIATLEEPPLPEARPRGHTDWVTSVAFSSDGTRLASASFDGTVRIWDVTMWTLPYTYTTRP